MVKEKEKNKMNLFLGIDLGGRKKRTTGICFLKDEYGKISIFKIEEIFGKEVLEKINPYLNQTKVIAIDAPLTKGRGKGRFRLYEKFLSTKIFRKEKVNPLPPALMLNFSFFAQSLVRKLKDNGFVLDINLIETFPTFLKKIVNQDFYLKTVGQKMNSFRNENQSSAYLCAILAYLHFNLKTKYLGYKDGFLFLPDFSFWKKSWQRKFLKAWQEKSKIKYHHLKTNLF